MTVMDAARELPFIQVLIMWVAYWVIWGEGR